MAVNVFPNAFVPVRVSVSVGVTATRIRSSSTLAAKFTICNLNAGKKILFGDSSIAHSSNLGVKILPSASLEVDQIMIGGIAGDIDLAGCYLVATAASTVINVVYWKRNN